MAYRTYNVANGFVVDPIGNGDFTTIGAALTAAGAKGGSGRIVLMPGTYTENPSLVGGWNLESFISDGLTPTVTINGNCTLSTAGTVSISGINLQTNSGNLLTVSGSVASIVNLDNCYLNCTNNTGISYTSTSASSRINLWNCRGDLGTTGIGLFSHSSNGNMHFDSSMFTNTGGSQSQSTCSAGVLDADETVFNFPITYSSTATGHMDYSVISTAAQNVIALTVSNTANPVIEWSRITSGSASAVSVAGTLTLTSCSIDSTNGTACITGSGTLKYSGLTFYNTTTINVTTQSSACGTLQGSTTTEPSAGFLGEQISSAVTSVGISTTTPTNITSISLTPGVWDISAFAVFASSAFTGNTIILGISDVSATFQGNTGDKQTLYNSSAANIISLGLNVIAFRQVVTTTKTFYAVGQITFTGGTGSVNGRLSAVRVG